MDRSDFPIGQAQFKTNLRALLHAVRQPEAAQLVAVSDLDTRLFDYDNWDGGTYTWALNLAVDIEIFATLVPDAKDAMEKMISQQANTLIERLPNHSFGPVVISPKLIPADSAPSLAPLDRNIGFLRREYFLEARELELEGTKPHGTGGHAEVWLARRRHMELRLAIKFLRPSPLIADTTLRHSKARERLLREAKILGAVRHSNVVRLLDCSLIAGDPVLVLEYVEGTSLRAMHRAGTAWAAKDAAGVLLQLLDALGECHRLGVVHRDIAPGNVIVEPNGRAVLIDFGLGFSAELSGPTRLTSQVLGTPGFSAPELADAPLSTTPAVDVFGAAALGIFLMTGRPPTIGQDVVIPDPLPGLLAVLRRGVDPNPTRRFASAEAMASALRSIVSPTIATAQTGQQSGILTESDCLEFLGIGPQANLGKLVEALVHRFPVSAMAIAARTEGALSGLALLLSAGRRRIGELWGVRVERCEVEDLVTALGNLDAAIRDSAQARPRKELTEAFDRGIAHGWLQQGEFDAWRPGMASGTGIRDTYWPTSIGYRWLKQNAGFDPPEPER